MRRVLRKPLNKTLDKYLSTKQMEANRRIQEGNLKVDAFWKGARQTKSMMQVLNILQNMMGPRQRCMYCCDSHGTDIEHFRPKAPFPAHMFIWSNLLLCCPPCGRLKGYSFPVDGDTCLLIDPSREEPWLFLDFDPITGNITARYDPETDHFFANGDKTVTLLKLNQREALANGYIKTYKRLSKSIAKFLENPTEPNVLISNLKDADEHGLLGWFFKGNGQREEPAQQLRTQYVDVWRDCQREFEHQ